MLVFVLRFCFLFRHSPGLHVFRVKEICTPQDEVPLYESKRKAIDAAREGGHIPGLGPAESQYNSSGYSADSNFKIDMFVLPSPSLNRAPTPITIAASTSKKKKTSIWDLRGQLHVLHHY